MNKNIKMVALVVALVALLGFGGLWLNMSNEESSTERTNLEENSQVENKNTAAESNADITISEDKKTVSYQGEEGRTALVVLKELTEVETKTESFGEFVTGINGVMADSSKEYWSFYVNGEYASEGAGTYQTKEGELIEWKLEAITQ